MKAVVLMISLFVILPLGSRAAAATSADAGKALFEGRCSPCHTIGGGVRVGPDLKGITELRPGGWLVSFISDPEKMFQSGDPYAAALLKKFGKIRMPDLGLSKDQVGDVLAYLKSQAGPAGAVTITAKPAPLQPSQGSFVAGEKLFIGLIPLENGGPPCVSCHSVSGIPFPGGGTLGPDLTGAYSKFGQTAINSILATLPFPTMKPIFDNHPLTLKEQQKLGAFFQKASTEPIASMTWRIVLPGVLGLILLMILTAAIWSNRLLSVRKSLVECALKRGGTSS